MHMSDKIRRRNIFLNRKTPPTGGTLSYRSVRMDKNAGAASLPQL